MKEKARFFQLQRHQQPELVTVDTSELDERVCDRVAFDTPRTQMADDNIFSPRPKNTKFTTQRHSCSLACSPRTAIRSTVASSRSVSSSKIRQSQHCDWSETRYLGSECFCDVPLSTLSISLYVSSYAIPKQNVLAGGSLREFGSIPSRA